MYGYIYLTTNLINGKKYIGQHKSSEFTESYKGSGKLIRQAFNKYGFDSFSVEMLDTAESRDELNAKEEFYISKYDAVDSPEYYNLVDGGYMCGHANKGTIRVTNGSVIKYARDYELEELSAQGYYEGTPPEVIEKMIAPRRGVPLKESTKQKMHEAHLGEKNHFYGKTFSEDVTLHLSQVRRGKIWITNGSEDTQINPCDLDLWMSNGYVRGRSKHQGSNPERWSERQSNSGKSLCWVTKNHKSFRIHPDELSTYLDNGFVRGRYIPKRATTIERITSEKDTSE